MHDFPIDAPEGLVSRRWVLSTGLRAGLGAGLGAGLAGLTASALSGCSSTSTPTGKQASPKAAVTPDVKTATAALAAVRTADQAVRATGHQFPAMRSVLGGLSAMHAAHEQSLVEAVPEQARGTSSAAQYVVPRRRAAALARLQLSEAALHDTLQGLALKAQSGDFARLLASMAAGVTVHRAALASGTAT